MITCDKCGASYGIGDSPWCRDQHAPVRPAEQQEVQEYYDMGLGAKITSRSQRRVLERQLNMSPRDRMSPGDISARKDRIFQQKREQGR